MDDNSNNIMMSSTGVAASTITIVFPKMKRKKADEATKSSVNHHHQDDDDNDDNDNDDNDDDENDDSLLSKQNHQQQQQQQQSHMQQQLFRPNECFSLEVYEQLEREDLTEEDIMKMFTGEIVMKSKINAANETMDEVTDEKRILLQYEQGTNDDSPLNATTTNNNNNNEYHKSKQERVQEIQKLYRDRRQEIHELRKKLRTGQARIDDDLRLLPNDNNDDGDNGDDNNNNRNNNPQPPQGVLPPLLPPAIGGGGIGGLWDGMDMNLNNNNNFMNNNINDDNNNNNNNNNNDEVNSQWVEQQERQAAAAIARAVQRYRAAGVPDEELMLVTLPVPPPPAAARNHRNNNNNNNLTFRRICIAVAAVVTAFLCIMLQTLPLFQSSSSLDPKFDKLMYEILDVIHYTDHAKRCPNYMTRGIVNRNGEVILDADEFNYYKQQQQDGHNNKKFRRRSTRWLNVQYYRFLDWKRWIFNETDCGKGVLHIPASAVIIDDFLSAKTVEQVNLLDQFVTRGINVSWSLPCIEPLMDAETSSTFLSNDDTDDKNSSVLPSSGSDGTFAPECPATTDKHGESITNENLRTDPTSSNSFQRSSQCFRGVHDDMIAFQDVQKALSLGSYLISNEGGDHFDIRYDVELLQDELPSILNTLETLLRERYHVTSEKLRPVAFRVSAVGPMNGESVPLYGLGSNSLLLRILNRTRYIRWMEHSERHNEIAQFSLPWPFRFIRPKRDTCNLMADMEADPRFHIHTSIFLSKGAGEDFRGGVALYVDRHPANDKLTYKVKRGVTIDGSLGRVIVSTGGLENQRCRLPTRAGLRATLQIWWER